MRTNIEIDQKLMLAAMRATGQKTKKAAVEAALKAVVRLRRQRDALKSFGKFDWIGDLDAMRRD